MSVFFTLSRSFYPSISSTTSIRADSSILEDIQVIYVVTKLRHRDTTVSCCAVSKSRQCNGMCHRTGYDVGSDDLSEGVSCYPSVGGYYSSVKHNPPTYSSPRFRRFPTGCLIHHTYGKLLALPRQKSLPLTDRKAHSYSTGSLSERPA